jgi:ribosomal protein S18 acetylase RimI-like enzyme
VLKIFDSNAPRYFDPTEKPDFEAFLKEDKEVYDVLLLEDKIVGAGGYGIEKLEEARICWYMIHSDSHKRGLGKLFLEEHLQRIKADKKFKKVTLMTSQYTDVFYEKLGFKTSYTKKDFWADRFDLYFMEMDI